MQFINNDILPGNIRATVFIPMSGKSKGVTIVDFSSYLKHSLSSRKISFNNGYARLMIGGKRSYLHRLLTDNKFEIVDHKNRNKLDNRMENLRESCYAKNISNSLSPMGHKFKGAIKTKSGSYRAQIVVGGKFINLGAYKTEEHAAIAYNAAAIVVYKGHALLNEVDGAN